VKETKQTQFISRSALAHRWSVSTPTIKRKEKAGFLTAYKIGPGVVRYALNEVERVEAESITTGESR